MAVVLHLGISGNKAVVSPFAGGDGMLPLSLPADRGGEGRKGWSISVATIDGDGGCYVLLLLRGGRASWWAGAVTLQRMERAVVQLQAHPENKRVFNHVPKLMKMAASPSLAGRGGEGMEEAVHCRLLWEGDWDLCCNIELPKLGALAPPLSVAAGATFKRTTALCSTSMGGLLLSFGPDSSPCRRQVVSSPSAARLPVAGVLHRWRGPREPMAFSRFLEGPLCKFQALSSILYFVKGLGVICSHRLI